MTTTMPETVLEKKTQTMLDKVEELKKRREQVKLGGGADKLEKFHKAGKLTARERVESLVDPGSFQESGLFAQHRATFFGMEGKELAADGVVTGAASIGGGLGTLVTHGF